MPIYENRESLISRDKTYLDYYCRIKITNLSVFIILEYLSEDFLFT